MQPKHPDSGSAGIVMKLIRWLTPIDEDTKQRLTDEHWNDVNAEFSRHQGLAEFFCLAGMFAGIAIAGIFRPMQPWDIGIMFGAMVAAPLLYIFAVCAIKGFKKTYLRWSDFSTMKYSLPWRTQFWFLYVPMLIAGAVSVVGRIWFPIAV